MSNCLSSPFPETQKRDRSDRSSVARNKVKNKQHDNGAHHGADQSRAFAWPIPAERLAQIGRNERTHDSQNRGEDKAGWLVVSRHDEFRDHARYESNNDGPKNAHVMILTLFRFSAGDGRQAYSDRRPREARATASPTVRPATVRFAVP